MTQKQNESLVIDMEVQNKNDGKRGAFFIEDAGKEVAFMHYVFSGENRFIIDHTVVDEAYEGKGLGRQLVKAGVTYAREHEMKILPYCPFAKKIFEMTPEYADVLF
ncbi:GNAT family N-acetyltransferase [Mucilaginibacter xinganensis]|uniref:GNAT family N-acetyltransferase n=1 Tax=Mucilaginibacter xinganensis TaxID=1234841 RepID=A0A223NT28_9SPHI|nr:GNAT family N-acetyltransferase [Mucilaginibacter xinganensis]ASU33007.1 GNAT family N-acetyltransferase [Mucilaginibacter xinganensis]